ncbi:MAG: sodium-dependent transporter [Marinobacterium sp.]|nr:sodium-dependent transporter [Marinobacterium sp.]
MSQPTAQQGGRHGNPLWSSRLAFILAATGSAVGLGNIWKFPYITGEYGGGAFVLVYLLCIALIGVPILIAEVMLGRRGRRSPLHTMATLAREDGCSAHWLLLGGMGMLAGWLILSFYSVIGGWSLAYVGNAVSGQFAGADANQIGTLFGDMLARPATLLGWHSLFMLVVIAIVCRGLKSGMEKAINLLMPLLFLLLLVMVGYAMSTPGFEQATSFLFNPDFSKLTTEAVLTALGHAFFTLSLASGAMMAYGSFLPKEYSVTGTAVTIAIVDTVVALLAGLAIFPLVFSNGLEVAAGPGLIFQTLPLAFGQMPFGILFGSLFFALLLIAAITSAISMLEPAVEWLEERQQGNRLRAALIAGIAVWTLGIVNALSFNLLGDVHPLGFLTAFEGKTIFDLLDYLTANIMLPLGGLLMAVYAGWAMSAQALAQALSLQPGMLFNTLRFVLRFISPVLVLVVFINQLV